ncbi:hypothetical protein M0811_11398 [Anaeramoeba ignava]|uniref:Uncharacterized protein n=1 Tax=Anaeramoeba ignava TaxID=1746090 RepID=A0A9Q0R859_ANAIG|nr:hypothetical protein M0811_11398 [Anaeramoeba ignava]
MIFLKFLHTINLKATRLETISTTFLRNCGSCFLLFKKNFLSFSKDRKVIEFLNQYLNLLNFFKTSSINSSSKRNISCFKEFKIV